MAKKISLNLSTNFLTAIIYATIGLLFCIFRQEVVSWAMLITGTLNLLLSLSVKEAKMRAIKSLSFYY